MSISEVGSVYQQFLANYETTDTTDTATDELGKEDFLTLLVTQLQNQDPLNPMESVDFTAQLAQFSSLEQLFTINDTLSSIQDSVASSENDQLIDYIGTMVMTYDNRINLSDGEADAGIYVLEDQAEVTVYIYNADGELVRVMEEGWKDAGECTITWDGLDDNSTLLDDGTYTFEVQAIDESGDDVAAYSYSQGEVTGVTYGSDSSYLIVGDRLVALEDIITVTKYDSEE